MDSDKSVCQNPTCFSPATNKSYVAEEVCNQDIFNQVRLYFEILRTQWDPFFFGGGGDPSVFKWFIISSFQKASENQTINSVFGLLMF